MPSRLELPKEQKMRLIGAVQRFPDYRILVVGDLILDVFIWGNVNRISPEAPVPVVEVVEETALLGGAANVVHNLATLGAQVSVAGLIGRDASGRSLTRLLRKHSIATDRLVEEEGRPTTIKTRIIAHNQQVVRFDRESSKHPTADSQALIISHLKEALRDVHAVIVSDYAKGLITRQVMDEIRSLTAPTGIPVMVDPKIQNRDLYHSVTMITPNNFEAAVMSGIPINDEETLVSAGRRLLDILECQMVLITRGKDGMTLFQQDSSLVHIPTPARRVYDVTGAGDTVIGTVALGIAAGLSALEAAIMANIAAGIVVGEVGTAAVSAARLLTAIKNGT